MTRSKIYAAIDAERASQDQNHKDRSQYTRFAPHILVLDGQLTKLKEDWYTSAKEVLQSRMIKMAAIAVRALEEVQ